MPKLMLTDLEVDFPSVLLQVDNPASHVLPSKSCQPWSPKASVLSAVLVVVYSVFISSHAVPLAKVYCGAAAAAIAMIKGVRGMSANMIIIRLIRRRTWVALT